jgi:acetolactate synthase-1/2/3 large subunit
LFDNDHDVQKTLDCFFDDLARAEHPVFLGGGGIHLGRAAELARSAGELLGIPCIPTWNALDVFASDYCYYRGRVGTYGGPGRNFAVQNADLMLIVGSRLSGRITGGITASFARNAVKYMVDLDYMNLDPAFQQVKIEHVLRCDAHHFLSKLIQKAESLTLRKFDSWLDKTRDWVEKYDPVLPKYWDQSEFVNPYVFIDVLSEQLSRNDVIVADCGGNIVVTNQAFKTKIGQRLCSSNGNSPMGYAFAGAIGACTAEPKGQVICLIGDGGFSMNIHELQTLKNYGFRVKTFIMNNHVYGIIKAYQDTNLEGRYEASGPKGYCPPDFIKIARAYEIETESIANHAELKSKITSVLKHPGPIVCDVNMHDYYRYEPRIFGWSTPIEDMYPYLPRDEFRQNMLVEPVPGWENVILPGSRDNVNAHLQNP